MIFNKNLFKNKIIKKNIKLKPIAVSEISKRILISDKNILINLKLEIKNVINKFKNNFFSIFKNFIKIDIWKNLKNYFNKLLNQLIVKSKKKVMSKSILDIKRKPNKNISLIESTQIVRKKKIIKTNIFKNKFFNKVGKYILNKIENPLIYNNYNIKLFKRKSHEKSYTNFKNKIERIHPIKDEHMDFNSWELIKSKNISFKTQNINPSSFSTIQLIKIIEFKINNTDKNLYISKIRVCYLTNKGISGIIFYYKSSSNKIIIGKIHGKFINSNEIEEYIFNKEEKIIEIITNYNEFLINWTIKTFYGNIISIGDKFNFHITLDSHSKIYKIKCNQYIENMSSEFNKNKIKYINFIISNN